MFSLVAVARGLRTRSPLCKPPIIGVFRPLLNNAYPVSSLASCRQSGGFVNEDYHLLNKLCDEKLSKALASPIRFQSIQEREDHSDIPPSFVYFEYVNKYLNKYRGAFMMKTFFDTAVYYQLFSHVKPKTVIEVGSFTGASAMWYNDTAKSLGYNCHIYSIDIDASLLSEEIKQQKPDSVKFIEGDTNNIEKILQPSTLQPLPHPWLIVEDSHENTIKVMAYLNQFMITGDYVIIEDSNPNIPADIDINLSADIEFKPWGTHKLDGLKAFLKGPVGRDFKIDSFFTDFYGYNCTWHWHGFLRKCDTK